jgi:hypothetical protein
VTGLAKALFQTCLAVAPTAVALTVISLTMFPKLGVPVAVDVNSRAMVKSVTLETGSARVPYHPSLLLPDAKEVVQGATKAPTSAKTPLLGEKAVLRTALAHPAMNSKSDLNDQSAPLPQLRWIINGEHECVLTPSPRNPALHHHRLLPRLLRLLRLLPQCDQN